MHDWTLLSIQFDWSTAEVTLFLRTAEAEMAKIVAKGVWRLDVPRQNDWGPSVSVNRVIGPIRFEEAGRAGQRLAIEMQSGDLITVVAAFFTMPESTAAATALLPVGAVK